MTMLAQILGKAANGLVRDRVKPSELNAVAAFKFASVVRLQFCLRGRKFRSEWIVNQVKRQAAPVAGGIELLERTYASLKYAFPALRVDVFFDIARQRGDDLHFVPRKVLGQP